MKLLKKINYAFKAQSDKFKGYNSFKCNLFKEDYNRYDLFFEIDKKHLKPLFETPEDEFAFGEYGSLREYEDSKKANYDELIFTIVFNINGICFEAKYLINITNGIVEFEMDRPMISAKEFVVPEDMNDNLAKLIKKKIKDDNEFVIIEDKKLDSYFSDKFLPMFIDYVEYLENIVLVDKCESCSKKIPYKLSGACKELYLWNRFTV